MAAQERTSLASFAPPPAWLLLVGIAAALALATLPTWNGWPAWSVYGTLGTAIAFALLRRYTSRRRTAAQALPTFEGRYKDLYDNAPDMLGMVDAATGRIIECNATLLTTLGYAREQVVGRHITELSAPQHRDEAQRVFQSFVAQGALHDVEIAVQRKDGQLVHVSLNVSPVRDASGKLLSGRCILRDIGERKRAERRILELNEELERRVASRTAELLESEAKWRSLVESAPDFILILDRDGTIRFINHTVNLPPQAIVGTSAYDRAPPGGAGLLRDALERLFGAGETVSYEFAGVGPGGTTAWYATILAPIQYGGRRAAILIARDITSRKAAEDALRDTTEQLEAVRRAMTSFVGTGDTPTASRHLLEAALAQTESEYGFLGVVIGERRPLLRILALEGVVWHPEGNREFYEEALRRYGEGGYLEFTNFDNLFGHVITDGRAVLANDPSRDPQSRGLPDGHPPLRCFLGVPVHHGGRVVGMIGVANRHGGYTGAEQEKIEILTHTAGVLYDSYRRAQEAERLAAEREGAARALRESEERFSEFADSIHEAFWAFDPDFSRTLYVNRAYERISGNTRQSLYDDPLSWVRIVHPDDLPQVQEDVARLARGHEWVREFRIVRSDGTLRWVRIRGVPVRDHDGRVIRIVGITEDVTEQKQAQEEAQRHQAALAHVLRLRTIDAMAAQLAHEINQPLGAIANFANGLVTRLSHDPDAREDVRYAAECIAREALRAGEIIRQIRRFVEKRELNRTRENIDTVIREAVLLVQPEARRLRVALRLDLGGNIPPVDIDAIHIQQVVLNLLRNGVEAVAECACGTREVVVRTAAHTDSTVEVTVADTGVGLPSDTGKLFDPFFTTKQDGLGMGLAIARSIVAAHGGDMAATPNDGGGATFRFTLPRTSEEAV